jgi:hypothetical protein
MQQQEHAKKWCEVLNNYKIFLIDLIDLKEICTDIYKCKLLPVFAYMLIL